MTESKFFKIGLSILVFIISIALVISAVGNEKKEAFVSDEKEKTISETAQAVVGVSSCGIDDGVRNIGAGIAVDDDGYILTCNSIIGSMHSDIEVTLNSGRKVAARPVWKNEVLDIALIKTEEKNEKTAVIGDAKNLTLGDRVYTLGVSLGGQFQSCAAEGIVSGMYRTIASESDGESVLLEDLIQTDADITVNNRGGALVNENGEVVGIIIIKDGKGFAVPVNMAAPVVKMLSDGAYIRERDLGIYCYDYNMMCYLSQNFDREIGVTAAYLTDGKPAQKSGIILGDVITGVNGRSIRTMLEFYEEINSAAPDDDIVFNIAREGKRMKIKIEI